MPPGDLYTRIPSRILVVGGGGGRTTEDGRGPGAEGGRTPALRKWWVVGRSKQFFLLKRRCAAPGWYLFALIYRHGSYTVIVRPQKSCCSAAPRKHCTPLAHLQSPPECFRGFQSWTGMRWSDASVNRVIDVVVGRAWPHRVVGWSDRRTGRNPGTGPRGKRTRPRVHGPRACAPRIL